MQSCARPANQVQALEGWARRAGHEVVAVYDDNGVSGAKGREYRQQFDAMLKAAARREFDMVAPRPGGPGAPRASGKGSGAPRWVDVEDAIRAARSDGKGIQSIARGPGVGVSVVQGGWAQTKPRNPWELPCPRATRRDLS